MTKEMVPAMRLCDNCGGDEVVMAIGWGIQGHKEEMVPGMGFAMVLRLPVSFVVFAT